LNENKYNILVTGASGFIGRALITELLENGHTVFGLVRKNISSFNSQFYTNILIEDISKPIHYKQNIKIDIIYHLAAKTHSVSKKYNKFYDVNVLGLKNILDLSNRLNIKNIIMLSSIKVNGEGFVNNKNFYSATSNENPLDHYGRSKLKAENLLKEYSKINNINFIILRPPLVYGAGVKGNLNKLMSYIDKNIPLPVVNTNNERSLIGLRNLVSALIIVAFNDKAIGKTYLVSDDKPIRVEYLYKNIAKLMNKKLFLIKFYSSFLKILVWPLGKTKLVDKISNSLIIDNSKIKQDTEWTPSISFIDELKYMVENRKI
jgi:nucleoside-diphosphate-sugar epimerase